MDSADASAQESLDLALLQMRSETLQAVGAALARIDDGRYGECSDCAGDIAAERLSALPFAVRCRECEGLRAAAQSPRPSAAAGRRFAFD